MEMDSVESVPNQQENKESVDSSFESVYVYYMRIGDREWSVGDGQVSNNALKLFTRHGVTLDQ